MNTTRLGTLLGLLTLAITGCAETWTEPAEEPAALAPDDWHAALSDLGHAIEVGDTVTFTVGAPALGPNVDLTAATESFTRRHSGELIARNPAMTTEVLADGAFAVRAASDPSGHAVWFAPEHASIGGRTLGSIRPQLTVASRGQARVDLGFAALYLTPRDGMIQQSWGFASAPGQGDLVVQQRLDGVDRFEPSLAGIDLIGANGHSFSYGQARWIDSGGHIWDVPTTIEGESLRLTVPAQVIASTLWPAVLDPTISTEVAAGAPIAGGSTGSLSRNGDVASSGSQQLVVWRDDRAGVDSDIYGILVDGNGTRLSANAFAISTAAGAQANPAVAYVGGEFVVVWEDTGAPAGDALLRGARVSTLGVVTQLGVVADEATAVLNPALAASGASAVLVFDSGGDIGAVPFAGGAFATRSWLDTGLDTDTAPTVAALASGGYVAAWSRGASAPDVWGQVVTAAGSSGGASFAISAAANVQSQVTASTCGANVCVAWRHISDVYGSRIDNAGTVLDTRVEGALTIGGRALVTSPDAQSFPSLACDGTSCMLAWQDRRDAMASYFDVYTQAFGHDLIALGGEAATFAMARGQQSPRLAATTSGAYVVWHDDRDAGPDLLYGARVLADGTSADGTGVLLSVGHNRQSRPALTRDGNTAYLAWSDSRVAGNDIYGVRINQGGNLLDAAAVAISTSPAHQQTPSTTFNGLSYATAWADARGLADFDIYLATSTTANVLTDTTGVAVTTAAGDQLLPDIAGNGLGGSLVVWQDRRSGTSWDIYAAVLTANAVVVSDIVVSAAARDQTAPAVTYDSASASYVVIWADARAGAGESDIYAARISTAGVLLDADGVLVSNATGGQFTPDIGARAAGTVFAAWEDRRAGGGSNGADVYGARLAVSTSGLVVTDAAGLPVSTATGAQREPQVSVLGNNNGTSMIVVWSDTRNGDSDIYGNYISAAGARVLANDYVVSASLEYESKPTVSGRIVTGASRPRADVAYTRYVPAIGATRVFDRTLVATEL